jgi:shikimate dehydrogenase
MRKIVALIGYPLGHSLSPAMHNAAFKKLGIDYEYVPFEVAPADLEAALAGMRALRVAGFNVTLPHKETIVPLLDEVTKLARIIGAVNTVKNQDGRLVGYNTDGGGFIDSLKEDAGFDPKNKRGVILGAGGASRAVGVMLAENRVKSLVISDIQEEKARALSEYISTYFKINCRSVNSFELQEALDQADFLVNASPVGMPPAVDECPLPEKIALKKEVLVYDLVYNPSETKLLKRAKKAGCKIVSGLGMLVRQGALAFTLFTGEEPPVKVMWAAAKKELRRSN